MRRYLLGVLLLAACAQAPAEPIQSARVPYDAQSFTVETLPTTTVAPPTTHKPRPRAARSTPTTRPKVRAAVQATGGVRTVSSTAYCLRGRMANGEYVHEGAVASRILPRGSAWRVLTGPLAGRVYVVKDTGGKAYFDIWFPSCNAALAYGRRSIQIAPA